MSSTASSSSGYADSRGFSRIFADLPRDLSGFNTPSQEDKLTGDEILEDLARTVALEETQSPKSKAKAERQKPSGYIEPFRSGARQRERHAITMCRLD